MGEIEDAIVVSVSGVFIGIVALVSVESWRNRARKSKMKKEEPKSSWQDQQIPEEILVIAKGTK